MSRSTGLPFIPPQASSAAGGIDLLFMAVNGVALLFSLLIVIAIVYFAVKYRRGHKVDRSNPPVNNLLVEILWSVIPLGIALMLFVWATALFLANKRMLAGATEIYVVGKQWMWKLQHPEGRWEMNELHVPVGRPIQLTMTSEDVIHSFYVPAFRLKQDVFPGEYTRLGFTATRVGTYHLFCAEFCGTLHSQMTGTVTVMEPADYEQWLSTGTYRESLAAAGERLFQGRGCRGCHGAGASVRAPSLEGIYGKPVAVQIPPPGGLPKDLAAARRILRRIPATTVIADERYIHDSILLPEKEIAAGYDPVMPTFKNQLREDEILKIVAYIKSLGTKGAPRTRKEAPARALTPEEYQARTGFIPKNIKEITR